MHSQNLNIDKPSLSRLPATKGVSFNQLPARSIATSRPITYQRDDNFKTDLLVSTAEAKNIYSFLPCEQANLNPSTLVEPSFYANRDTTTSVGIQNPKFTGDPLEFKSFINNFETHVEPRVSDEKTLLCLLLQHCTNPVKDKIEHFSDHDDRCYTLAKQRSRREYGSP